MCGGHEPLDLHVANPMTIMQEIRVEVNDRGTGNFAGAWYSSHHVWAQGSFHIWPCDPVNEQHVAEVMGTKLPRLRVNV